MKRENSIGKYAGKKVVVTGGTHGMGFAMVTALLEGGAEVLLTGRNAKNLEVVRRTLDAQRAHTVRSDTARLSDIGDLGALVEEKFGQIDAVIINAGVSELGPFDQVTEAQVSAAELVSRGVRVNAVGPGFVDTPTMGVAGLSVEERARLKKLGDEITPMKGHGSPDKVARAALFLAFDATFITGIELAVDGGLQQIGAAL